MHSRKALQLTVSFWPHHLDQAARLVMVLNTGDAVGAPAGVHQLDKVTTTPICLPSHHLSSGQLGCPGAMSLCSLSQYSTDILSLPAGQAVAISEAACCGLSSELPESAG